MAEGPMLVGRSYGGGLTSVRWVEWMAHGENNDAARDVLEGIARTDREDDDQNDSDSQ